MTSTRWRRWLVRLAAVLLPSLALSVAGDRALRLLGLPAEASPRVTHPPDFRERRRSAEFEYLFETNSRGLRYREIPLERRPGERRVLVVGDSFTEGVGVEAAQTFAALLEGRFSREDRPARFINAGLAGTGPLEYGRVFLQAGVAYDPTGLLIVLHANDVSNTPPGAGPGDLYPGPPHRAGLRRVVHALWPRLYTRLHEAVELRELRRRTQPGNFVSAVVKQAHAAGIPPARIDDWKRHLPPDLVAATDRGEFNGSLLSMGLLRPRYWTDALDLDTPEAEASYRAMAALLTETVAAARRRDMEVALVYTPATLQIDPAYGRCDGGEACPFHGVLVREAWQGDGTEVERRVQQWSVEHDVPFLDLTATFRDAVAAGGDVHYRLDGHWNAAGHGLAAGAIASWLVDRRLFGLAE